jgi:hypothetical protein
LLRYASEKAHASREIPAYLWELMQDHLGAKTIGTMGELIQSHPNTEFTQFLNARFNSP